MAAQMLTAVRFVDMQAAVWMEYYVDCSEAANSVNPLYQDFATMCETTLWGSSRRDRCDTRSYLPSQLDTIQAECCPGAAECSLDIFDPSPADHPGCKCAVEEFYSRCVSHVDYTRYIERPLQGIGFQLDQLLAVLAKTQSDAMLTSNTCELEPSASQITTGDGGGGH